MITHNNNNSQSSRKTIFRVLRQISYTKLFKKYTSGNFSYHKILANNLIFNDTCRIVARFKDYLIFDDNTEFLRRFYTGEESHPRLDRILTFYETYSKIFPNYMILKESKYLYRNIRKKQKMIDAVNEIKREEEENRKKIKQNNGKINKELNELFTKRVKEEIKTFQENTTFERYRNNFDSENEDENENSISISVMNRKMFFENIENKLDGGELNPSEVGDKSSSIFESFVANETNHSISGILNVLNDNKIYIKDLPKLLEINNYSKNSQKLKNNQKKTNKKKQTPEKQNIKNNTNNNQLSSSHNKLEKLNNKKNKKYEISSKQHHNKNISSSNNLNGNSLANKGFKKLSTPSSGTTISHNIEKNFNELNQYQNIIIPKGNTVININNNYFEQIGSSSIAMGYYTNKNFKTNKNSKINKNTNSNTTFKKSNTNNYKTTKNKNPLMNEKKNQQIRPFKKNNNNNNNNNGEQINKDNNDKKHHYKQISQDYIYQKNKNSNPINFNKNEKCITNNENNETSIKEKILKFGSLSPQPTITHVDTYQNNAKKFQNTKNEKKIYNNYFTENNDPNLITGDTKGNEEDDEENKERETLLLHIRDLIENKGKNNIKENENNTLLLHKSKIKQKEIEDKYNKIEGKYFSNNDLVNLEDDNFTSKSKLKTINKENIKTVSNKNEAINKKAKANNRLGLKKLQIKDKKNKTKGYLKNNNLNNNYNTNSKLNKEKNKNFFRKTNNNFKNNKNLFSNLEQDNTLKSIETNNKIIKKNKLLNENNNQKIKPNKSEAEIPSEKSAANISHNILYRSPNSQLAKLLMSQKKEENGISENNTTSKIYYKGKIQNMKYKKNDLNLDSFNQNNNLNMNISSKTNLNNFCSENFNNKYILTDMNNTNDNTNSIINSKGSKGLTRTHNINNSDLRNKYKSFLLKKNKQKSVELENQSAIQQKMNKQLLERMSLIKQNNKNNFYQKYKENKEKLRIKSYVGTNIGSFDNFSNSHIITNSIGNSQNYARNSVHIDNSLFQTPSIENKKLGLYKKVIRYKPKMLKTDKKLGDKKGKNFDTPSTIKVNRSKFFEKVKDKFFDNNKMITMSNFNTCFCHQNF